MNDAGVDRCAAQSGDHKADRQQCIAEGQQDQHNTHGIQKLSHTDHLLIVEFHRQKAAEKPSDCDAYVKQARPAGGGHCVQTAGQGAVTGGPHTGDPLNTAVKRKTEHYLRHTGNFQQFGNRAVFRGKLLPRSGVGGGLPQRQAEQQQRRQHKLQNGHYAVAVLPGAARQRPAHDDRAARCADAPHAVQPAHVAAFIVQGHIIVQRGVHTAGAQAIRHSPQAKLPELRAGRKPKQRHGGGGDAERCDPAGAELIVKPVAGQAGHDGPDGDDHGHAARPGHARAELRIHAGPRRAQQRVRQAQADERQIDDRQKQRYHTKNLLTFCSCDIMIISSNCGIYRH